MMTETEFLDYFIENYTTIPVDRAGTAKHVYLSSLSDIKSERMRKLVEQSASLLVKILCLFDYTRTEGEEVVEKHVDFSKPMTIAIGVGESTMSFYDNDGHVVFIDVKRLINPKETIEKELEFVRKKLSDKIDRTIEKLGKLAASQEEMEKKIKDWRLEDD